MHFLKVLGVNTGAARISGSPHSINVETENSCRAFIVFGAFKEIPPRDVLSGLLI